MADTPTAVPVPKEATLGSPQAVPVPKGATTANPANFDTFSDVLKMYAPNWTVAHPTLAAGVGAVGNALQGGGRELVGQGLRLVHYISPRGGDALANTSLGQIAQPLPGTAQTVGRVGTQVGEALALPEARGPLPLRLAQQAGMGAGLVGLQGGSPLAGAGFGAGAEALGTGLRMAAPALAEKALSIKPVARAFGKTPGKALLEETSGLSMPAIVQSSGERLGQLVPEVENMAQRASTPGNTVSLQPALDYLDNLTAKAIRENSPTQIATLTRVARPLQEEATTGAAIPTNVSPLEALNLKRGLRNEFANFRSDPTLDSKLASRAAKGAAHEVDSVLDKALGPEFANTNQRISSLIEVNKAADRAARGKQGLHLPYRLAGPALGGIIGYERGGLPEMWEGAALGAAVPELLGRDSTLAAARALYSPAAKRALRGIALPIASPVVSGH